MADLFPSTSPFCQTQALITGDDKHPAATHLRLVPPVREDRSGTDLQARFENCEGRGFWVTLVTFPEAAREVRIPPPFPDLFPLPEGFGRW